MSYFTIAATVFGSIQTTLQTKQDKCFKEQFPKQEIIHHVGHTTETSLWLNYWWQTNHLVLYAGMSVCLNSSVDNIWWKLFWHLGNALYILHFWHCGPDSPLGSQPSMADSYANRWISALIQHEAGEVKRVKLQLMAKGKMFWWAVCVWPHYLQYLTRWCKTKPNNFFTAAIIKLQKENSDKATAYQDQTADRHS